MKRQAAERRGHKGEALAAFWLQLHGWRVLARRLRTPVGAIDLVVRRGRTVAFVEVKARATTVEADLSLDRHRLRRVAAAANAVLARYVRDGDTARIDALFIVPRRWPRHVPDVWQG